MDTKKLEEVAKELAKDIKSEKDLSALSKFLVKLTVETALNAEMQEHLGYSKNSCEGLTAGTTVMDIHLRPLKAILVDRNGDAKGQKWDFYSTACEEKSDPLNEI